MDKKTYDVLKLRVVQFVQDDVLTESNEMGVSWLSEWNGDWGGDWSNQVD